MNTERVFTAFNKEGKEILLYRKDRDTYIDLNSENNSVYPKEDIDLETIIHASKSLNLFKHMLKSSITRKYKKDREKLIETKNVLFGLRQNIINLKTTKIDSGWRFYNIPLYNTHYKWDTSGKVMGLYIYSKSITFDKDYNFKLYKNLYDHNTYFGFFNEPKDISSNPNFGENMKYVMLSENTLESKIKETYLEKKLVYEYANQTRKEVLENNDK
ncbi:MAG: hypothetical protein IJD92_02220 [Bacilli bacterium]|nr:hypothetical protein [Bacilli bacterium]